MSDLSLAEKTDKKYGFVILHYLVYEMTAECVSKLLEKFGGYDVRIVVVDNASGNGSGEALKSLYEDEPCVTVILNNENLGFARGNDVGYKYLADNFEMDYIIVMNNDVLIEQDGFLDLIDKAYAENRFDVLGPDIYSLRAHMHQSPMRPRGLSLEQVKRTYDGQCRFLKCPVYYRYRNRIIGRARRTAKWLLTVAGLRREKKNVCGNGADQAPVLHGACYVFSKDFVRAREHCFNPGTFLYIEEDILHYECVRDGLVMRYDPRLKVDHLEDVSTNAAQRTALAREIMKSKELKKSLEVLMRIMEEK